MMKPSSTLLARNPPEALVMARGGTLGRRSALPRSVRSTKLDLNKRVIRWMSVTWLGNGRKVRVLAIVASVSGLLLATGAFLFWAANGLPYQDATAALLRGQYERAVQIELVMLLGIAITTAGSLYLWRSRRRGER